MKKVFFLYAIVNLCYHAIELIILSPISLNTIMHFTKLKSNQLIFIFTANLSFFAINLCTEIGISQPGKFCSCPACISCLKFVYHFELILVGDIVNQIMLYKL